MTWDSERNVAFAVLAGTAGFLLYRLRLQVAGSKEELFNRYRTAGLGYPPGSPLTTTESRSALETDGASSIMTSPSAGWNIVALPEDDKNSTRSESQTDGEHDGGLRNLGIMCDRPAREARPIPQPTEHVADGVVADGEAEDVVRVQRVSEAEEIRRYFATYDDDLFAAAPAEPKPNPVIKYEEEEEREL